MNHKSMKPTELLGEYKREYKEMNLTVVKEIRTLKYMEEEKKYFK